MYERAGEYPISAYLDPDPAPDLLLDRIPTIGNAAKTPNANPVNRVVKEQIHLAKHNILIVLLVPVNVTVPRMA